MMSLKYELETVLMGIMMTIMGIEQGVLLGEIHVRMRIDVLLEVKAIYSMMITVLKTELSLLRKRQLI